MATADLQKRQRELMDLALKSFQGLLKAAAIDTEESTPAQMVLPGELHADLAAANMAKATEGLLRLSAELKIPSIQQDQAPGIAQRVQEPRAVLERSVARQIDRMQTDVQGCIAELEDFYYDSAPK